MLRLVATPLLELTKEKWVESGVGAHSRASDRDQSRPVALRGALRKAVHTGVLVRQPLRPLSLMLTGALTEAAVYVAQADDTAAAHEEVDTLITTLLTGLRMP